MKKELEVKTGKVFNGTKILLFAVLALILAGGISNCGGGSSSGPAQAQVPKTLIQEFVAKHGTMVDSSLVKFYVADEQPTVAAAVQKTIDEKTASGELEKLLKATFDFSNLQISVVGEKDAYVNDQPSKIIKVNVSGSYIMTQENNNMTIPADKTIILEMVNNTWKVTEKNNPWS